MLTDEVLSEDIQFHPERLQVWLTEIEFNVRSHGEDVIRQIELRIVPDTWFQKWLFFCLVLARRTSTPGNLVESLKQLSENVEVFKGKPRACDLYNLHEEIRDSFRDVLMRLEEEQWVQAIRILAKVSSDTSTWLKGSRSGPLPLDVMFDLCLQTADTACKRAASSELAAELLGPEQRSGEFYDTHARDSLLLARIHVASGQRQIASVAWRDACTYLMGYGWRKDITVYEVLDPLETLGKADPVRTRECITRIQPIVERVLVHTDGRETWHAIHKWIDLAASIHPAGALSFLARREIARQPAFGDFDHAIPRALAALTGEVNELTLASGWLAAGSEAQSAAAAAIEACEKLASRNDTSNMLWQALIASLEGDGFEPPAGLEDIAKASAERLGLPEPVIEGASGRKTDDQVSNYNPPDTRTLSQKLQPTIFIAPQTPFQMASALRRWRDSRLGRADAECVINAVGWRLVEFIEQGDEVAAEMVIRRLALDASSSDRDGLLVGIAAGLKIRGYSKLSALAKALAYTSGRDGWLHFGGPTSLIREAIQLDSDLAWSTLAEEISSLVARGGTTFATKRLVELLAAEERLDDAFSCWRQACDLIGLRLPRTGPKDEINVAYDSKSDDATSMLAAVIAARINHVFVHEKRFATTAAALLARYQPLVFSTGFSFAFANQVPPWTLVTLLQILFKFESSPYRATRALESTLRSVVAGELVSGRALARALLKRAELDVPTAPPNDPPACPAILKERASDIAEMMGTQRLKRVNRLWPEFESRAVELMAAVYQSDDLRYRMRRTLDRFRLSRKGRRLQLWYPVNEEIERVLQITGTAVGGALARQGVIDPSVEDKIGVLLLRDIETIVRLVLSRVVRPTYAKQLSSKPLGLHFDQPMLLESGSGQDWILVGFHETDSKVSGLSAIDSRIETYSGVVFGGGAFDGDSLPFGHGDSRLWSMEPRQKVPRGPLSGPLSGLQFATDPFGVCQIFVPHPALLEIGELRVVPFDGGLTLIDKDSQPAIACRIWRARLIGGEYVDDREHRLEGLALLVRGDLFTTVSSVAENPPRLVTVVSENKIPDQSE